ncbi:MAG: TlpA family protein disulfide reductase [Acidobacteriota bacterium]
MRYITSWFLALCLASASVVADAQSGVKPKSPLPGNSSQEEPVPAPDFTVLSLTDDSSIRLSSLRGKVVIINFWASWCPPCRAEFPFLVKLYHRYKEHGVVLLSLNFAEEAETARYFIQQVAPPFPVYAGAVAAAKYNASQLPTTYFIDRAGRIRRQVSGFHPKRTEAEFTNLLDKLLAEPIPVDQL